jgi:hypothetical protein
MTAGQISSCAPAKNSKTRFGRWPPNGRWAHLWSVAIMTPLRECEIVPLLKQVSLLGQKLGVEGRDTQNR